MNKKTLRDITVGNKIVMVRADLNVPLDPETNDITDNTRIQAVIPTLEYLLNNGAAIVLCSHLGRPNGEVVEKLRLAPVGKRLSELMGRRVITLRDCIGVEVESAVSKLKSGDIILLENLRFHPGEKSNNHKFAQSLAKLADVFVDDAFGTAHRKHASNVGITSFLPSVAGFLIEKELESMGKALDNPARPLLSLVGGAKVGDKMKLLRHIMEKVNILLIGGGMACTFMKARGYDIGQSLVEEKSLPLAHSLLKRAASNRVKLVLPVDVVVAESISNKADTRIITPDEIQPNWHIVDIGPKSIEIFLAELERAKTVIWNGPVGILEIPNFSNGTEKIVTLLAQSKATTIICGGSTTEAVQSMGLANKMSHVSTGGGAALKFLAGETLPAVEALLDK